MNPLQLTRDERFTDHSQTTNTNTISRRDALRVLGCLACGLALPSVLSACVAPSASGPAQVASASELTAADQYKLMTIHGAPSMVYASGSEVTGSVQHGPVWIVAYSRACTHRGTTIDAPSNGQLHCPNHGQDFDASTGQPVGNAGRTNVGLTQHKLEARSDGSVWFAG
jgi:cytochrome b6-f complex iron-sulfur subunit